VYVGRVAHEKNIGFLVEVVARLRPRVPDILLLVAGEGPALEHLRRRVRRMGLEGHVRFVGYLSRQGELGDCYCAGDAFVFASRTETQGLVILEAMALGVPVVSTAVMGTRDVLREGQGALVAEDDVGHFAGRVRELLGDPDLRARLGAAGRAYAAGWSSGAMAERMLALYGALAARRRTA
jgi:glycosyltransferase involved in cell wall biosynthesis